MLLYGHNLYAVVTSFHDARQHIILEFGIRTHLLGILRHAYVAFVDKQRISGGFKVGCFPCIRLLRTPYLSRENLSLIVLNHAVYPSGNALTLTTFPINMHLVQITMVNGSLVHHQFPVARSLNTFGGIFRPFFPVVEVANQINGRSMGCPLPEHPPLCSWMQTKIMVSRCKLA